jgi:hypothetical protein
VERVLSELNRPGVYAVTSVVATANGFIDLEVETARTRRKKRVVGVAYVGDWFTWYKPPGVRASVAEQVAKDAFAAVQMLQRQ